MINDFEVSAPGKVLLFGEHAVVYGATAVATALNLRTRATFSQPSDPTTALIELDLPDVQLLVAFSPAQVEAVMGHLSDPVSNVIPEWFASLDSASKAFLTVYHRAWSRSGCPALMPVRASFHSELPIGAGLGSSASYSSCLSLGLLTVFAGSKLHLDDPACLDEVNQSAFCAEKVIHGNPSGVDNATVVHGGFLTFKSGVFLPVDTKHSYRFLLIHTKVPRNTKTLVAGVRARREAFPAVIDPIISSINAVSQAFMESHGALSDSNMALLMAVNHSLLNALGVGHASLDACVKVCASHGVPCKLTGAGGGGCAIAHIPSSVSDVARDQLVSELENSHGFRVFSTAIGARGVSYDA
jgi:mevalonate kinase